MYKQHLKRKYSLSYLATRGAYLAIDTCIVLVHLMVVQNPFTIYEIKKKKKRRIVNNNIKQRNPFFGGGYSVVNFCVNVRIP